MVSFSDFLERLKSWITWTWTYLWLVWFILVVFLFYILKGPLKLTENVSTVTMFFNTLTPKFYVALTGTSSLISGLILIFEWWYFKKYGTSFIEQVSLNYISSPSGQTAAVGNGNANSLSLESSSSSTSSSTSNDLNISSNNNDTTSTLTNCSNNRDSASLMSLNGACNVTCGASLASMPECKVWKV